MTATRRRCLLALSALLALCCLAAAGSAGASSGGGIPPTATLRTARTGQAGELVAFEWRHPNSDGLGCVIGASEGGLRFRRRAATVPSGRHLVRVNFANPQQPEFVQIDLWTAVDGEGRPLGRARFVRKSLRSAPGSWTARFVLPDDRQDYLKVYARWQSPQPCSGVDSATWAFHLRST